MNRYTIRLLVVILTISLLLPLAACGKNTTATTMHLKRTEGTVTVSDDAGEDVPLLEDLGLYSGYGVDTRSESYAWINLDDVKLTKMDQESEIAIQKEGKFLDIEVISGSLFFNVTQPLEEDETLNIRTSTMLMGIRGTCGWADNREELSQMYLLEGSVECSAGDETVQVNAGEMAELTADGNLVVEPFTVRDIPAFVLNDLIQDPDLCRDIYDASGLDVLGAEDFGDDILAALENAKDGDVITLDKDYEPQITERGVYIFGGSEDDPVILDLNGHTLSMSVSGFEYSNIFSVCGALQIRDSSTGGGKLEIERSIFVGESAYLFLDSVMVDCENFSVSGDSTFIMNSGTVGGHIASFETSTFIMNGGTIESYVGTQGNSTFIMNSGTVGGNTASFETSTFIMNGGAIKGHVYTNDNSTFTMYDGKLTSQNLPSSNYETIDTLDNSTFTMYDGTITGNVGTFEDSIFTMYGGSIEGDVDTLDNSNFIMNGGTIDGDAKTSGTSTFTKNGGTVNGFVGAGW